MKLVNLTFLAIHYPSLQHIAVNTKFLQFFAHRFPRNSLQAPSPEHNDLVVKHRKIFPTLFSIARGFSPASDNQFYPKVVEQEPNQSRQIF